MAIIVKEIMIKMIVNIIVNHVVIALSIFKTA